MLRKISLTFVFLVIFSFTIFAQQRLIMIGGGDRTPDVLAKMVDLSGGETGNILVITWASGVPQESFDAFKKDVEKVSKIKLIKAPFRPLDETGKAQFLQQLGEAKGIFFGGGDQTRIMEVLKDETIRKALIEKYNGGTLFSGSSAGTAIMSEKMITGEGDFKVIDGEKVEVKPGLGLLNEAIVDQHFIVRQRQNRLMGLIWKHPNLLGIGIDEDTAFYVKDNRFGEVLGASKVMILDAKKEPMKVMLLKSGDKFDLKKRKKI
jgi:cyanophycinase